MVTRLSGGLTPADGSDPRTFPTIWNDTAGTIEAQGTAISGAESDIDALEADSIPTDVTSPSAGEKLVFDGTNWVNLEAYAFVETVTFTSNGTFSKGDYPWLRAIRVRAVGGGGGGGSAGRKVGDVPSEAGGAGGGGYAEKFITNIFSLSASETITVGSGGSGGAAPTNNGDPGNGGNNGGSSQAFGLTGNGGNSGSGSGVPGLYDVLDNQDFGRGGGSGDSSGGDVNISGSSGGNGIVYSGDTKLNVGMNAYGGGSYLGGSAKQTLRNSNGQDGINFGGGGSGASAFTGFRAGGNGANGIVIVELYA